MPNDSDIQKSVPESRVESEGGRIRDYEMHYWGLPPHFFWDTIGIYRISRFTKIYRRKSQKEKTPDEIVAQFTKVLAFVGAVAAVVSVMQFVVIKDQLGEMRSSSTQTDKIIKADDDLAKAANDQSVAAINLANITQDSVALSQRAWVGPTSATMDSKFVQGQDNNITIGYQNTGKQPAFDFFDNITYFTGRPNNIETSRNIYKNVTDCQTVDVIPGSQVVYPSSGFGSGGQSHKSVTKDDVSKIIQDESVYIYIFGCFAYKTFEKTHYSAFCFGSNIKSKVLPVLNFCSSGNYAN